ncbi:MAG: hypothetical protein VXZ58_06065 [Actinomycetota bacterium]|nr:hypothetical protein [Actinomycetota bacterium]
MMLAVALEGFFTKKSRRANTYIDTVSEKYISAAVIVIYICSYLAIDIDIDFVLICIMTLVVALAGWSINQYYLAIQAFVFQKLGYGPATAHDLSNEKSIFDKFVAQQNLHDRWDILAPIPKLSIYVTTESGEKVVQDVIVSKVENIPKLIDVATLDGIETIRKFCRSEISYWKNELDRIKNFSLHHPLDHRKSYVLGKLSYFEIILQKIYFGGKRFQHLKMEDYFPVQSNDSTNP